MRSLVPKLDRSVLLGAGVLVASIALLAVSFVSIYAALNNDGADLPDEGSLQEIIGTEQQPGQGHHWFNYGFVLEEAGRWDESSR